MINTSLRHFCSSPKIVGIRKLSTFHNLYHKAMETSQADRPMGNVNKPNMNIDKKTYVTRRDVNEEVKENREKFLRMPKEEKRKLYKKKKFVDLDEIETWQQQAPQLLCKYARQKQEPISEANETLNNKISLWKGDITTLEIDAVVNAANNSLLGGGGVDGAIHSAAGSLLREECATINPCDTGDAKITAGYKLPAKYIIHTVGPIGINPGKLSSCYKKSLAIVKDMNLRTVAFPCISTGIYGYDIEKATPVVLTTVLNWLKANHQHVDRIIFCVFLSKDIEVYEQNLLKYFPISRGGDKPGPTNKKAKKESEKVENKSEDKKLDKDSKTNTNAVKNDENVDVKKAESGKDDKEDKHVKVDKDLKADKDLKVDKDGRKTVEEKPLTRSKVKTESKQMTMDSFVTKKPQNDKNESINDSKNGITDDKEAENCDEATQNKICASNKL